MVDPDTLWSALAGITVAAVSGVLGIIAGSKKAKADIQSAIAIGFNNLVDQLQEERAQSLEEIRQLRVEVASLRSHIVSLEAFIRRHELEPPLFT